MRATHHADAAIPRPSARNRSRFSGALLLILASGTCAAGTAEEGYGTDPTFIGGQIGEDAYSANLAGNNQSGARAVARFPNGDIVVASLVRQPDGNQTNGFFNVGLARYDAAGNPVLWSAPSPAHSHAGGRYVVYPNTQTATFAGIRAVEIIGDKIVVLTQSNIGGDGVNTTVLVFRNTGAQLHANGVFSTGEQEYPSDIAVYRSPSGDQDVLITTGVRFPYAGGHGIGLFTRTRIEANGALTPLTSSRVLDAPACRPSFDCRPQRIALARRGNFAEPDVFVAAQTFAPGSTDARIAVLKLDSDGVAMPGWNFAEADFNLQVGRDERPVGIAVRTTGAGLPNAPFVDTVFVANAVTRACFPGTAVFKLASNGVMDGVATTFGGGGQPGPIGCLDTGSDFPEALAFDGDRLAVAGYTTYDSVSTTETFYANTFAVLDTDLGLRHFADYSYPIGGPLQRHSVLFDVVPSGDGTFTAVGEVGYRNHESVPVALRNKLNSSRMRFRRVSVDFADGFE